MVTKQKGSTFLIIILFLSIMLMLVFSYNKIGIMEQKATTNNLDLQLARNANLQAIMQAESFIINFDTQVVESAYYNGLTLTCKDSNAPSCNAIVVLVQSSNPLFNTNCQNLNVPAYDLSYNKGLCSEVAPSALNISTIPNWMTTVALSSSNLAPCSSYTQNLGSNIAKLDLSSNAYSLAGLTSNNMGTGYTLCAAPRFMFELVYDKFQLINSTYTASINYYGRVYQIISRAFGQSGDTRTTLLEYLFVPAVPISTNNYQTGIVLSRNYLSN